MPAIEAPKEEIIPADHVRLKVRGKGDGKIATGERSHNKDVHHSAGDIIVLHKNSAKALLDLDYVDLEP